MGSSFSSAWHGGSSPPEAVECAVCRVVDCSKDTAYSPWWVEEEAVGCRLCLAKRSDRAENLEQKQTEEITLTLAVDGAALGSSLDDAPETKSECKMKEKGGNVLKNGLAKLLTRSRNGKGEDACPNIRYPGVNADVGAAQLSAGLPSDVGYAARGLKPLQKATSPPPSGHGFNAISLLTKSHSNSNIDSKTEGSGTESNSDEKLHILAPEDQDDTERKSIVCRETFPLAEHKMSVVKTGLRGLWSTARRQRAGSFDPSVSNSSRISISTTDFEGRTLSPYQPSSPKTELSSQTPSTQSSVSHSTEPDDAEDVSGPRPLTALEVLKKPFPTELFDDILNGRGRSRSSSSTSLLSSDSSRRRRTRRCLQSPSSRGQSNSDPEFGSGSESEVGNDQDEKLDRPPTINPSRFPRLPPAVTRCTSAHDGEDSPTTFLAHVDELDVVHQRRSAIAKTFNHLPPSHHPLRRTKKSANLNKDAESVAESVGGKTVRFFMGHLPTGTVPRIAISSVPDEKTHILPPNSEIDRSSLSVNKKLHGATLVKRNAQRRAERSLIAQKRAVRVYKMELGSNGGDEEQAKAKAEKWLNCEATRMFVAGWIREDIDPITNKPGTWRDVDEIWGYGGIHRKCHPTRCFTRPCGPKWCQNQKFVPFKLPEPFLTVQPKKQRQQPEPNTTALTTKSNRSFIGSGSKQQQQPEASPTTTTSSNSSENALPMKNRKRDSIRHAALKAKKGIYKSCRGYTTWRTMDLFCGEGKAGV